jgi:hypothetical protein
MSVGINFRPARFLTGILVCLALVVALAGCYYYYPEDGSLELSSPTSSVYTSAPTLSYTASHDVKVTLNGSVVTTVSGEVLGAVAGLNTLVVDELDNAGGSISEKTVTFFMNDLMEVDSNGFADIVGWTSSTTFGASLTISDSLAVSGATDVYGQGLIYKAYTPGTETPCIQSLDVLLLTNTSSNAVVGFVGSSAGEMLGAQLVKSTSSSYTLNLIETSPTLLPSPYYKVVATSELSSVYAGDPITVYCYRNGGVYQAVAAASDGDILASAESPAGYTPVITLAYRGIVLQPYDQTGNTNVMVEVDNYSYCK